MFNLVLENLGVVYENDDEYMEYFNTIDIDQNGFISYEEFEQVLYDCYDGDSPDTQD